MEHFESFCQLVQEYIDLFDHLIQIEEEKIEAVNKNQITFVENCMNHEQAAVLKLRGLELSRKDLIFLLLFYHFLINFRSVYRHFAL